MDGSQRPTAERACHPGGLLQTPARHGGPPPSPEVPPAPLPLYRHQQQARQAQLYEPEQQTGHPPLHHQQPEQSLARFRPQERRQQDRSRYQPLLGPFLLLWLKDSDSDDDAADA
ncbi:hypothetical protein TSOC_011559 [Tetrabaena socialis]|uniref:Uncharacterized protein n=1 Tax=Tetrabaena socialis TaxID=47790 RepID=A0A2J7ZQC0_9CHLO|nr:hypothetical protein TSOC_011559 [Tetrabaena socialis]|eukprot:PNH02461.1 hypothetical protein TSOC_011559 [Tetrabaena socialis]